MNFFARGNPVSWFEQPCAGAPSQAGICRKAHFLVSAWDISSLNRRDQLFSALHGEFGLKASRIGFPPCARAGRITPLNFGKIAAGTFQRIILGPRGFPLLSKELRVAGFEVNQLIDARTHLLFERFPIDAVARAFGLRQIRLFENSRLKFRLGRLAAADPPPIVRENCFAFSFSPLAPFLVKLEQCCAVRHNKSNHAAAKALALGTSTSGWATPFNICAHASRNTTRRP